MAQNPKIVGLGSGLGATIAACEASAGKRGGRLEAGRLHFPLVFLKKEAGATAIGVKRRDVAGERSGLIGDSPVIYDCGVINAELNLPFDEIEVFGTAVDAIPVRDTSHASPIAFAGLNRIQAGVTGFCPAAMAFKALGVRPGTAFS